MTTETTTDPTPLPLLNWRTVDPAQHAGETLAALVAMARGTHRWGLFAGDLKDLLVLATEEVFQDYALVVPTQDELTRIIVAADWNRYLPRPDSDPAAAWELLEHIRRGRKWVVTWEHGGIWVDTGIMPSFYAPTDGYEIKPALCRAYLAARQAEERTSSTGAAITTSTREVPEHIRKAIAENLSGGKKDA